MWGKKERRNKEEKKKKNEIIKGEGACGSEGVVEGERKEGKKMG